MAYYGIDLGTSNCLAARFAEGLEDHEFILNCLRDEDGEDCFPSIVSFQSRDQYLVGEKAQERLYSAPDSTVELIKVRLGTTASIPIVIEGETTEKSPQEITALLLRHLCKSSGNRVTDPVLTVPAIFDQSQKNATMEAGQLAQTNITQLIEEPTAAIIYQIYDDYQKKGSDFFGVEKSKNVLVFDFGGGTLDLSLIQLTSDGEEVKPTVLAIHGDSNLGGNLIDFELTDKVLSQLASRRPDDVFIGQAHKAFEEYFGNYRTDHKLRFSDDVPTEIKNFIFRLKRELERVKISLSSQESERIFIGRGYEEIPITRKQFVQLAFGDTDLNNRIRTALQEIIKYSNNASVDEVLLVGGSAQIPYVQELIMDNFERVHLSREFIKTSSDYSHAVAKGAAIQAALSAGVSVPPFRHNRCTSVVARDIVLYCGNDGEIIAKSGTPYPFTEEKTRRFRIPHALATAVQIQIKERIDDGTGKIVEKTISDFQYYLPLYYTDDEMLITFNIDSAGLYQVKAKHVPTNERVEFESHKAFALSESGYKAASTRIESMTDAT